MSKGLQKLEAMDATFEEQKKDIKTASNNSKIKPLILSTQRFNRILNNMETHQTPALAQAFEEQKHEKDLKGNSDLLGVKVKENIQGSQDENLHEPKRNLDERTKQVITNYEKSKENEARNRQEKIVRAKHIVERLKPGPRSLHSAFFQSEILRSRNVQRAVTEKIEATVKKQNDENNKMYKVYALNGIKEKQQHLIEQQFNTNEFKKELLQTISENEKQHSERKKQLIKEEQASKQATDIETKMQIEKEKAIMEKKKEILRKNALEAMKMVEQRRQRDRIIEGLEDRLCSIYNEGKAKLDAFRNEEDKSLVDKQQRKIDAEVRNLTILEDNSKVLESERVRRDKTTMQLKFTAEEQEKVRRDKAAKQARIEAYMKEMQQQKEMKHILAKEKQVELVQRLKNSEIDRIFAERQKQQKLREYQNVRAQLAQQIEDNKKQQLPQKEVAQHGQYSAVDNEHKYFLQYAHKLAENAEQKGKPLYPLVKAVNQYKRENQIDCNRKVPKYMQSNVPIGEKISKSSEDQEESKNCVRENVMLNSLKSNDSPDGQKRKGGQKATIENGGILTNVNTADGRTSHNQLRYSMDHLKKMNTFSARTCY